MGNIKLTKNASDVLKRLHKEYKKRMQRGMSKSDAADFDSAKSIHESFFPKWSFDDVDSACAELLNAKLLNGFRADGYVYSASLSDAGIVFNQKDFLKAASSIFGKLLELLQAIRSLLPW